MKHNIGSVRDKDGLDARAIADIAYFRLPARHRLVDAEEIVLRAVEEDEARRREPYDLPTQFGSYTSAGACYQHRSSTQKFRDGRLVDRSRRAAEQALEVDVVDADHAVLSAPPASASRHIAA